MTKKSKASARRINTDVFNDVSTTEGVEESVVKSSESFEVIPESNPPPEDDVVEEGEEEEEPEVVVEKPSVDRVETSASIPAPPRSFPTVSKPRVVYTTQANPEPSGFLSPSTMRLGIIAGGGILGIIIIFMLLSGGKKKKGPTIVEVTEVPREEKASKASEVPNNRVSSPRIIFGDLRKNPSLAVAPSVSS